MPERFITIENNGQEIVRTNYWGTEHAAKGYIFLSINAGAFRLLVPDAIAGAIADMLTASEVIVSRGPWPDEGRADALELLFDDHTNNPFCLHIGSEQVDRMPSAEDRNKTFVFAIWTPGGKVKELPGRYRIVKRLPCLKPWRVSQ